MPSLREQIEALPGWRDPRYSGRHEMTGLLDRQVVLDTIERWVDEDLPKIIAAAVDEALAIRPVALINLGPDATPADEANLRVQFALAVAAERARLAEAVRGLADGFGDVSAAAVLALLEDDDDPA